MTMIAVNEKTLRAIDRLRAERGIRTRAKALEIVFEEIAPDTDDLSESSKRRLDLRLKQANLEPKVGLSEIKKRLGLQ
jgi:hypothetical protein